MPQDRPNMVVPPPSGSPRESRTRPSAFVTVSVDDGHPSDIATAALLCKFGLRATFYVPRINPERPVMAPPQIIELASMFEIGGHTLSHVQLPKLRGGLAWNEIN